MPKDTIALADSQMKDTLTGLQNALSAIRTGRANASILDKILVDAYGATMPVSQVAVVSVPDARQLLIKPYDKSLAGVIANTISKSDLGVQATKDGDGVRVSIPPLNTERRKELVKLAAKRAEEHKVSVRNIRRETNDVLKKMEKDGEVTKDELARYEGEVQKLTDRSIADIDKMRAAKEADIMEV